MDELINHLADAPIPNLLIISGLIFLGIAIVGNISGKIAPGISGRIMAGVLGVMLVTLGMYTHSSKDTATRENPGNAPLPSPSPKIPAAQGFRVVEVLLRADPADYSGPCPAKISFSGRISVVGGAGTVSYKFLRNDGASAPVEALAFDSPGSKEIGTTWTIGGPGLPAYSGWQAVQIFDPQEMKSNQAPFKIQCQ